MLGERRKRPAHGRPVQPRTPNGRRHGWRAPRRQYRFWPARADERPPGPPRPAAAADKEAAIRCYAKVGFRPVGVPRRYERGNDGRYRDGLLMDLLADEFIE